MRKKWKEREREREILETIICNKSSLPQIGEWKLREIK